MKYQSISAVFPSYNEEKNLTQLVESADRVLKKYSTDHEIIVVNDGSKDNTGELLENIKKKFSQLKIITHQKNLGYGVSLREGFAKAQKELIFYADSDNQFDLEEIGLLLNTIDTYDAVIGYRKKRKDNLLRIIIGWIWKKLNRFLFGLYFKDIDCGFKLFRAEILHLIINNLRSTGTTINTEILIKLKKIQATIGEIPVTHYPRMYGRSTGIHLNVVMKAFWELAKIYKDFR